MPLTLFERVRKGCVWEGVGDRTKTATYWPASNSSGYHSLSFLFSWAAQPGAWGPRLCWDMVLIPASSLQLIWTSCRWGYIIIWRPPTSCERHNSHSIQPLDSQGHPLISLTRCTCYLHRCISYFDSWAGSEVNMQHQVLQFLYQSFGDCTKSTNYNWYYRYFYVPQFV